MGRKSVEERVYKRQNKREQRKMAKPLDLAAKCAILNDELLKKNQELEALKANLQTKLQAFEECKTALQNGESRMRESRISQLKKEIKALNVRCAKLNDDLLKKNQELEKFNAGLEPEQRRVRIRLVDFIGLDPKYAAGNKSLSEHIEAELPSIREKFTGKKVEIQRKNESTYFRITGVVKLEGELLQERKKNYGHLKLPQFAFEAREKGKSDISYIPIEDVKMVKER
ncbi:hypothetical protein Ddc_16314 [Ditylenchus destructor]|nr:hypothetical protein Ddc_16314 [Ditylenchus destructor]